MKPAWHIGIHMCSSSSTPKVLCHAVAVDFQRLPFDFLGNNTFYVTLPLPMWLSNTRNRIRICLWTKRMIFLLLTSSNTRPSDQIPKERNTESSLHECYCLRRSVANMVCPQVHLMRHWIQSRFWWVIAKAMWKAVTFWLILLRF